MASIVRTLAEPTAIPFLASVARENVCLPIFLSFMDQVRANVSSVWPVKMSSQSFDLVVENDMVEIGGSLRDATGMDRVEAFFASEPTFSINITTRRANAHEFIP